MHNTCKGGHSHQLVVQYPKFLLKIDHQQNDNPKYPQLCTNRKKEKEKSKERRVGIIIPG